ncbi:hypothetical protein BRARA_H02183 [Brassica rapa]|uniref:Uncharacterized protein n=2 Tax=Brassica TaxID=3705 RepID=A0A397YF93_BRACM|nr:uncharacterized protein LOC106407058 [Brassica napus]RID51528.1 hypothetical protein BRARA_H02183 [Brassica rapa]CAF2255054.1 unnamed protein product [Brassica napus]
MAASILSSIIFFLLFIIPSLFVDAHMEHRKLSGTKETMTMRRNLEGSGHANSKIATPGSTSRHSGQKNIQHKPSKTRPDQLKSRISYEALKRPQVPCTSRYRCHRSSTAQPPSSSNNIRS